MGRPLDAEDMDRIEIERIPREAGEAVQTFVHRRKKKKTMTAAVRITVTGVDGAVITDVWTRERFRDFFETANQVIADG